MDHPGPIADTCLRLLDAVHCDRWDSFRSVLDGVTEAEAAWVPPGYDVNLHLEEGWPANGSILWQANHILACKTSYLETLLRREGGLAGSGYRVLHGLEEVLAAAGPLHRAFRDALAPLPDREFARPIDADGTTLMQHLENAIRHEAWHSGQIAVIRRLYRWHPGAAAGSAGEAR